jgi:uncharacterized protein YjbJ (UPF0337 family)
MNKDQAQGKMKDLGGKAQQKVGEITGDEEQQAKGVGNRVKGKAQEGMGDLKNAARNLGKDGK